MNRATASWIAPAEAKRQLNNWAVNPLTIRRSEVATVVGLDGQSRQYPLVVVDDRPDIRDFIRRHALDGDGDAVFNWRSLMHPAQPSFAAIRCQFRAPIKKVFSLKFDMRKDLAFLRAVASANCMALSVSMPQVLIIEPCGLDLRHMLSIFMLGEALQQRRHG